MIWLSVICIVLVAVVAFLTVKIVLMKKDIGAIDEQFAEKLKSDTNTLLSVSGNDKSVRRLAASLNEQLKVLRSQRLRYEQGDSELKNAIANISHDLRTPLTAIDGYLGMLENEQKSDDAERYISIIKNRTEILKQLSEELFRYSVITSPDYDSPKERVSVNAAMEECLVGHYAALKQAGIEPQIKLTEKTVYCTANRVALLRIFSNLVSNAIKYGDGDLFVELTDEGEITFSNAASKLTNIQVNRLFDRFYTVESARKSTGLGLSIAKVLTEQIGGTIGAKYEDGRLIINIVLPLGE